MTLRCCGTRRSSTCQVNRCSAIWRSGDTADLPSGLAGSKPHLHVPGLLLRHFPQRACMLCTVRTARRFREVRRRPPMDSMSICHHHGREQLLRQALARARTPASDPAVASVCAAAVATAHATARYPVTRQQHLSGNPLISNGGGDQNRPNPRRRVGASTTHGSGAYPAISATIGCLR